MSQFKISACCQLGEMVTNKKGVTEFKQYDDCKVGTITITSMAKLCGIDHRDDLTIGHVVANKPKLQSKLISKLKQNLQALNNQIKRVSQYPDSLKAFRITSNLLPLYTEPRFAPLYDSKIMSMIELSLSNTGKIAIDNSIRLSSHPSQFTTLSSDKDNVIDKSIIDLEHHVMIFKMLGMTPEDHGVVINIHANGKSFTLPERAKHLFNWISLENDEGKAGHKKCLMLCQKYDIRYVFDLHHYYCETGDRLDVNSDMMHDILNTWGTQRPIFHLSQPRSVNGNHKDLCAHSDIIDDKELIEYTAPFLYYVGLDIEAKHKNVASEKFYQDVQKHIDF